MVFAGGKEKGKLRWRISINHARMVDAMEIAI